MLHAIADEAGNVALHQNRMAANAAKERHHALGGRKVFRRHGDDFDERHEMRRIPEMRAQYTRFVRDVAADIA